MSFELPVEDVTSRLRDHQQDACINADLPEAEELRELVEQILDNYEELVEAEGFRLRHDEDLHPESIDAHHAARRRLMNKAFRNAAR